MPKMEFPHFSLTVYYTVCTVQELLQIDFFSSSLFGNLAKDESQIFLSYLLFRSFADYKLISLIIFQNVLYF